MRTIPLLLIAASLAQAQTFEVASIKPTSPDAPRGSRGGPGTSDPSHYRFGGATLLDLIATAYDVDYYQISSKEPLDRQPFDLVANVPEGATKAQFREMMKGLLVERFHLKVRIETRDLPAYELTVAKSGVKFKESVPGADSAEEPLPDTWPPLPPGKPNLGMRYTPSGVRLRGIQQPLATLARVLRPEDRVPVIDKTGLTGTYDFKMEYAMPQTNASPDAPSDPSGLPSLFGALQDQLGLQLTRKKLPFQVVVVESFDKLPVDN